MDLDILSELVEDGENNLLSIHIEANADDTSDQVICLDVDASLAAEIERVVPVAAGAGVDLTWSDCGDASTHAKVTDLQPTHLDLGTKATLVGKGTLDKDESSGTFKFVAKAGPIPVLKGSGSLCEDTTINLPLGAGSLKFYGLDCPVKAGDIAIKIDADILSSSTDANDLLDISLTAESDDGDKLLCMDIKAKDVTQLGCLDDGVCALDTRDCCSGTFHTTLKCGAAIASKRCGCVAEGDCALKLEDCCSGAWHSTLKCGGGVSGGRCDAGFTQV